MLRPNAGALFVVLVASALPSEEAGLEVTDTMRALRNDWLGSKAGS